MLYLLGAGAAYPPNRITNDLLEEVSSGLRADAIFEFTGIETRSTVLSLDYIRSTGNADVFQASAALEISTSELGFRAAQQALERAGIAPAQVGLVLGESSTPIETTPSEAQRIANRFELKCPAYDVFGSSGSLALHLHTLSSWRSEVLPDYILCVYSNTPTTRTNYRNGMSSAHFGDAGAAVVLSPRVQGKFSVIDAGFETQPGFSDVLTVSTLGHIDVREGLSSEFIEPQADRALKLAIERLGVPASSVKCIGPQFRASLLSDLEQRNGVAPAYGLRNLRERGYAFGSSAPSVVADYWDDFRSGDNVALALAGAGLCSGFVCLKA